MGIVNSMALFRYKREKIRKIRRAFLPHPARRKSESRRFEKISRGKTNPFLPQKMLCFAPSTFRPAALPEYLEGRTPKEKHPFLFQKKFHPRQIRNVRSVFLSGLLAYSPVRGAFSERTILVRATTRSARVSFGVLLEMSPNFLV